MYFSDLMKRVKLSPTYHLSSKLRFGPAVSCCSLLHYDETINADLRGLNKQFHTSLLDVLVR